jgi:imidazolonepropionase-like amidohydrolase
MQRTIVIKFIKINMMRSYRIYILGFVLFFQWSFIQGQQVKKAENGVFLLKNSTIHTITNGTFVGDILLRDGIIADIGTNMTTDNNAKVIDCTGKHIYPGLIDSGCRLGLVEIDAVSVTNDFNEHGDFVPHMKALTAVNPNAVAIPVTRVNGVTTVFTKPEGSTFPGTGAMIDLFGYSPDQMSCGSERVVMKFPSTGRRGRWDRRSDDDIKKDAEKALKNINDIWENAFSYMKIDSIAKADKQPWLKNNPQMDALLPITKKEQPIFIEVNAKNDIETALEWVLEKKIKAVFMGVAEGWRVADKIAKAKIPVIVGPVLNVPRRDNDRFDAAYTNPGKMAKAGVKVAIRTDNAENTRNLPFNAGFAAAYGMGVEEALKAVTINPAEIFGVSDRYGSLEKGKVANIIICTGDPFETKTQIEQLFIRGWNVPLESRHTLLYDEFLERSPGTK